MEKLGKRQFNKLLKNSSVVICDGAIVLNDGNNRLEIRYSVHNNRLSIYGLCNFNNNMASIGCDNTIKKVNVNFYKIFKKVVAVVF